MATEEEKALKALYPASSVSSAAKQIAGDPDLFGILMSVYEGMGTPHGKGRLARLKALKSVTLADRKRFSGQLTVSEDSHVRGELRAILSSDKRARREFAVQARKFLSERAAGDAVEKKRLRTGQSRVGAIIKSQQTDPTKTTALGRSGLSEGGSRVRSLLGQAGALGA